VADDVEVVLCFKDIEKFNYLLFCLWLGLLFCRLLWSGFGELISVMERDLGCSMDNLYEQCESRFLGMMGVELSKEQRDVGNAKLYEAG
jgi:hypothetical protein